MVQFWHASSIGRRPALEDIHVAEQDPVSRWMMFAVCDGHGGTEVVQQLQRLLPVRILAALSDMSGKTTDRPIPSHDLKHGLEQAIIQLDEHIHDLLRGTPGHESGSTLILLVYHPVTRQIATVNVGDSRAVVEINNRKRLIETHDHKPDDPQELLRIQAAGSFVRRKRVAGILAVSRALGDFPLKLSHRRKKYHAILGPVSSLPDILIGTLHVNSHATIVLGCDGIWDVMTSQRAIDTVKDALREKLHPAQTLIDRAFKLHSYDNLTALVIYIPPVSSSA